MSKKMLVAYEKLAPSCPGAVLLEGKMLNSALSQAELKAWVESL